MENVEVLDLVGADGVNVLFGTDQTRYVVPVYQRPFAWGRDNRGKRPNEIVQLMEDVLSASSDYYLGSLVVAKSLDPSYDFEVIDGQQRLTALYIIFACLGYKVGKGTLGYACRDTSKAMLELLAEGQIEACVSGRGEKKDLDEISGIRVAVRTVRRWLAEHGQDVQNLKAALTHVKLFRIEVPEGTDLNRYFEIMNTRGEQLEQQDIVKASLMGWLRTHQQREVFAEVWDACSDMDGYFQMHFSGEADGRGPSRREEVFEDWTKRPRIEVKEGDSVGESGTVISLPFDRLVDIDPEVAPTLDDGETYKNARFESIIDFPHFLLHVLHVFNEAYNIHAKLQEQTDSAKLQSEFHKVFGNEGCRADLVMQFIRCLATCRYYFDKYILKREYGSIKDVGSWSLKELARSETKGRGKEKYSAYYKNTLELSGESSGMHAELLKIEACLRVSYTNPKVMHWITKLLIWLNSQQEIHLTELLDCAKRVARDEVKVYVEQGDYNMGVKTPNIVLNYLDYLLWENRSELSERVGHGADFENFDFEFRNSVEHWYPQHPSTEGEGCPEWSALDTEHGVVDRLGNLALLQSNVNARFSNQPPKGKCGYVESVGSGSLKLRIMAKLTNQCTTNDEWRTQKCEQHENEMLRVLKEDCAVVH